MAEVGFRGQLRFPGQRPAGRRRPERPRPAQYLDGPRQRREGHPLRHSRRRRDPRLVPGRSHGRVQAQGQGGGARDHHLLTRTRPASGVSAGRRRARTLNLGRKATEYRDLDGRAPPRTRPLPPLRVQCIRRTSAPFSANWACRSSSRPTRPASSSSCGRTTRVRSTRTSRALPAADGTGRRRGPAGHRDGSRWEYHNLPAVAREAGAGGQPRRLLPAPRGPRHRRRPDSREWPWLPRRGGSPEDPELWFVNTPASPACVRGPCAYSFVPHGLAAEVRQLAHRPGGPLPPQRPGRSATARVRYATALGIPTPRADGGSGEEGRWHPHCRRLRRCGPGPGTVDAALAPRLVTPAKLWVLNSGGGGPGHRRSGGGQVRRRWRRCPGFASGLDFVGPWPFVGLCRRSGRNAVFQRHRRRGASGGGAADCCGVWVVNMGGGQVIAYIKFEEAAARDLRGAGSAVPSAGRNQATDATRLARSFVLPDESLAEVSARFRRLANEAVA